MGLMEKLNSLPMFLIAGAVILMVMVLCIIFMVKSYRAGIAIGMEKEKLRSAITSSATFTLLPSVSMRWRAVWAFRCPGCAFRW